jgi:hypothetical protein
MQSWICRLFSHDIMRTSALHRVCVRCGQKERLRNLGHVEAWVVARSPAVPVPVEPRSPRKH